ncbi:Peptidoglycan-associated lipoprotein [Emticicia aquatica]|jgi:outer membrane protein OmpA-like peptidoglycan-associated protein|uniref:Peptidoglycan-associated lipoprotein n=1 Tax=Emticicia aquatica TaxID=1681835 RepID=A0ABN8F2B9_9BACT|nr:OmpA family protein [Emticicia aquatica]CAH0997577.1 Peptidoglycan-associated lipoprotein [Emticicia aquatica]
MSQETKKVTLKGIVKDQKSKMPLAAQIKIIYKDVQLGMQEVTAKADGSFEVSTLQKSLILQARVSGYIVSNIMMNLENINIPSIIAEIPLVFNGRAKRNQLLLEFAAQKKESENNEPINKQVFQATDAIDGSSIAAKFRFIDTNNKEFLTHKTSLETPVFEHNFVKKENFTVEVTANGFQKFLSDISIETFDATIHENTAKLIKNISFLNLIVQNEAELQNINLFQITDLGRKSVLLTKNSDTYYGSLVEGATYRVTLNTHVGEEISKEFVAFEGINQVVIALQPKKPKPTNTEISNNNQSVETKVVQVQKQTYLVENKTANLAAQTIFFDQSSCSLNKESKILLEEISKKMLESPELTVEITGHTDNIGDFRQNQYLSEFRAKVISSFLFNKGIKDSRIKLKGNGSNDPNSSNDNEENRQKNRRAELRFY